MFTGLVGPVEVFFYWPEAVFGDFSLLVRSLVDASLKQGYLRSQMLLDTVLN